MDDILHLNNFSEMSLIHTLRTRYHQVHWVPFDLHIHWFVQSCELTLLTLIPGPHLHMGRSNFGGDKSVQVGAGALQCEYHDEVS